MSVPRYTDDVPREERSYKSIYGDLDIFLKHKVVCDCPSVHDNVPETSLCSLEGMQCTNNKQYLPEYKDTQIFDEIVYSSDRYDMQYLGHSSTKIAREKFEIIMDRLEKEWFLFVQRLINNYVNPIEPADCCSICTHSGEEDGAIVVCQGCNVSMHQDCYGVQEINDFWICRSCIYYRQMAKCMFCPSLDGCLKQTSDNKWGHVLCVEFNKTLSFAHPAAKEPIDVDDYVRKERCVFCTNAHGTVIGCAYFMCSRKYHATCALEKCYFDMNNKVSYCDNHDPLCRWKYSAKVLPLKYFGYKRLSNRPRIRKKKPEAQPRQTLFMKMCNLVPLVTPQMFSRLVANDLCGDEIEYDLMNVCEYWETKRRQNDAIIVLHDWCFGSTVGEAWHMQRCKRADDEQQKVCRIRESNP
jgi:NuA3 HAT complex component NTO1